MAIAFEQSGNDVGILQRQYYDNTMGKLCEHHGNTLGVLWEYYGNALTKMGIPWEQYRDSMRIP